MSAPHTAFLFPGQGAQYPGMASDLVSASPAARAVFAQADAALGMELSALCFHGSQDELNRTDISQPAILAHSWAVIEALGESAKGRALIEQASSCAGLSLGEYSALAFAGAIRWDDALRLVRARGRYMQEACDAQPSTMASILGIDDEAVIVDVCKRASERGVCVAANFNAAGQVAIAGTKEAVAYACELAKAAGARRCMELSVAGAFHSPLMEPARERLAREIAAIAFADPRIPVYSNVTARPVKSAAEAKQLLVAQLTSPVRWAASMVAMVGDGVTDFVEVGPGTVLVGLLKRVAVPGSRTSIGTAENMQNWVAA